MPWYARGTPQDKSKTLSANSRQTAFFSEPGAVAGSASYCLAPWQSKCCARSTSRSLPWDPRLISRWQAAANASFFMPPHFERPPARARRLPAELPPIKAPRWCCFMCCRPSTSPRRTHRNRSAEAASLPAWTTLRCVSCVFLPPRPAPAAARPWTRMLCMATRTSRYFRRPRNARRP